MLLYQSATAPHRALSVDLLGEILVKETVADNVDIFIIRQEYDPFLQSEVCNCYLLHAESKRLGQVYYYPVTLSEIVQQQQNGVSWKLLYDQLDKALIQSLLALGLDCLGIYALIKSHPRMQRFLSKPLVLLLATRFRRQFETMDSIHQEDYKYWVPTLFDIDRKLSRGLTRTLARLDYTNPDIAIRASRHLLDSFHKLRRFIPDSGSISGESICLMIQLLEDKPELDHAHWLCLAYTSTLQRMNFTREIFEDTKLLMQAANIRNIEQTLLLQPHCLSDIERLHDRYMQRRYEQYKGSQKPFQTWGMEDHQYFTLVRTAGELYAISSEFNNCASIYIPASIKGYYVHWLYRNHGESALLQLDFCNPEGPRLKQFYGPNNIPVSSEADCHCKTVVQKIAQSKNREL